MQETHSLIIDIGNSRVKYYYLDTFYSSLEELFVVLNQGSFALKLLLISTDKSQNSELLEQLQNKLGARINSTTEFDPLKQQFISDLYPGIGADRVAKLIGTTLLFPDTNILLFDFGTALTTSILNSKRKFLGGYINLGFKSSLKALAEFCYQLEDYSALNNFDFNSALGKSPAEAIINGNYLQIVSYIDAVKAKASEALLNQKFISICTGGDAKYFTKYFDHHIEDIKILSMFAKSL